MQALLLDRAVHRLTENIALVFVKFGTTGTENTATVALGSEWAYANAQIIANCTSAFAAKSAAASVAVGSTGNLVITEGSNAFTTGDLMIVIVSKQGPCYVEPTLTTV